jgi:hypothetical protein
MCAILYPPIFIIILFIFYLFIIIYILLLFIFYFIYILFVYLYYYIYYLYYLYYLYIFCYFYFFFISFSPPPYSTYFPLPLLYIFYYLIILFFYSFVYTYLFYCLLLHHTRAYYDGCVVADECWLSRLPFLFPFVLYTYVVRVAYSTTLLLCTRVHSMGMHCAHAHIYA